MNRVLFRKEMRENRWKLIGGLLYFGVLAVAMVMLYDLTVKMMGGAEMPEAIRADLQVLIKDYALYLWGSWFGKNLFQSGLVFSIIVGMGMVSAEVSKDTMGFLLARPVRREEVFATKYFTGALMLFITVLATSLLAYYVSAGMGKNLSNLTVGKFLLGSLLNFTGFMVLLSLTILFSTLFNETLKAGVAAGAVSVLAGLPGWFPQTAQWSIFRYMQGIEVISGKGFPWPAFLLLVAMSAGLYYLGLIRFCRRDF